MAGMTLAQFWDSTPFELSIVLGGYSDRLYAQYQVAAFATANIMNCWTKRRITPRKLLGPKPGTVSASQFRSRDDFEAFIGRRRSEKGSM